MPGISVALVELRISKTVFRVIDWIQCIETVSRSSAHIAHVPALWLRQHLARREIVIIQQVVHLKYLLCDRWVIAPNCVIFMLTGPEIGDVTSTKKSELVRFLLSHRSAPSLDRGGQLRIVRPPETHPRRTRLC